MRRIKRRCGSYDHAAGRVLNDEACDFVEVMTVDSGHVVVDDARPQPGAGADELRARVLASRAGVLVAQMLKAKCWPAL